MSERDWSSGAGFKMRITLARVAAAIEGIWPVVWPAVAVVTGFLILSLLDVWAALPAWLHLVGLVLFAALLGLSLRRGWRAIRLPNRDDGLRRLEQVNVLGHEPLRSLDDRIAAGAGDSASRLLWQRHRERVLASLSRIRVGAPRSALPKLDPYALRAALMLVLVVALVQAGGAAPERLQAAFDLERPTTAPLVTSELTVWLTPPAYTGEAPVHLEARPAAGEADAGDAAPPPVRIPEGSEVLAQLHHAGDAEAGNLELGLDDASVAFETTGEGSAEATLEVDRSGALVVRHGERALARWDLEAVPDLVPEIELAGEPEATHRGVLRLGYRASDDYGVVKVTFLLNRPGAPEG
ncbi:MAG: DUF4175 family protein, partial [Geminicoccaceae bacterium]|nr:DUF4175 family protein [Geminicoccaceae bacterium]